MKNVLIGLFAIGLLFSACNSEKSFKLSGKIEGTEGKVITLSIYDKAGVNVLDTVEVIDGIIKYENVLEEPVLIILGESGKRGSASFFADNVAYTINGNIDSLTQAKVTGGDIHNLYQAANNADNKLREISSSLRAKYIEASKSGDTATANAISAEYDVEVEKVEQMKLKIIEENPLSPVSAYIVYELSRHKPLADMKESLNKLDNSLSACTYFKALEDKIAKLEFVAVGQMAPDFTLLDVDGNELSLSSLKGSVLLIDFWASWCGPCRRENPHVVELYEDYKERGFDILGVSLDNKKEDWLKAIEEDKLTWNHVSDLKGWKSAAAQLYAVSSIPHTVLLDTDGKIVAKDLRGDELRAKVAELLD